MSRLNQLIICLILVVFLQSCYVSKQAHMSFLNHSAVEYEADVLAVKVPVFLLRPLLTIISGNENLGLLRTSFQNVNSIRFTALKNIKDSNKIHRDFRNYVSDNHMEEYMNVKSEKDHISVNVLMKKDKITKLMLGVSSGEGEHIFIEVKGNFTMDEISQAINSLVQE